MIALTVGASILALIGLAVALDGPPLFWRVGCFTEIGPFMRGQRCFATKEGALEFHAGLMATIQKEGGAEELLEFITRPVTRMAKARTGPTGGKNSHEAED